MTTQFHADYWLFIHFAVIRREALHGLMETHSQLSLRLKMANAKDAMRLYKFILIHIYETD